MGPVAPALDQEVGPGLADHFSFAVFFGEFDEGFPELGPG